MEIKRESIARSAFRSFCRMLAGLVGLLIGLIIIGAVVTVLSRPQSIAEKTQMVISPDANGSRALLPRSTPAILKINIHGFIGSKDLNIKTMQSQLFDSREGALKQDRVKGVLLHISSPGGTAFDGEQIYEAIKHYKEKYQVPVYAYVNGLCASAAYFIACSADKIYSPPVGLIGSIGVRLGPNFNVAKLMERHGIKEMTITEGKHKDILSPFREWKPDEAQSLIDIAASDYALFVDRVTTARPRLDKEKLIHVYGAQIFDPDRAEEYGYIDRSNSSYRETLTDLVNAAKIEGEYQVVELKVTRPVFSEFMEGKSPMITGKIEHELSFPSALNPELSGRSLYLYSPALQWPDSYETQ